MEPTIANGWLLSARKVFSPNHNARPQPDAISLLVIHNISLPPGRFGNNYVEQFFCNCLDGDIDPYFKKIKDMKVSAHLLIARTGELVQFVAFDQRAWHAGESSYQGRGNCNDFSIGIELEGCDHLPYTDRQYHQLSGVARVLMRAYPAITRHTGVGHSDIAPGRKTDPGPA